MAFEYPQTTKALRFTTAGNPLELTEKAVPSLAANEILVRVNYASINPCDIQIWQSPVVGLVAGDKGLGRDYSGTVVAVGSNVKKWEIGDKVFGVLFQALGQGTFSQYIRINPASDPVAKNPGCFTDEQAAAVPLVALTAFACLDWLPPPRDSPRRVIIQGASGGTGSWLIQIAKLCYDCHVTAICSSKNAEYVRSLGADEVIDYTTQDIVQTLLDHYNASGKSDLLIDCVGGTKLLSLYQQILHTNGAYVTIVGDKTNVNFLGGPVTYITNPSQIIRYFKAYFWGPRYACVSFLTKGEYLEKLVGLGERGELKVEIQEIVEDAFDPELQGWRKATEAMQSMRVRGKIVLRVP